VIVEIWHGFTPVSCCDKLLAMMQHKPPWMPEGIFFILCLAIFIPAMYLFALIWRPDIAPYNYIIYFEC
jgi:hypothetical protein